MGYLIFIGIVVFIIYARVKDYLDEKESEKQRIQAKEEEDRRRRQEQLIKRAQERARKVNQVQQIEKLDKSSIAKVEPPINKQQLTKKVKIPVVTPRGFNLDLLSSEQYAKFLGLSIEELKQCLLKEMIITIENEQILLTDYGKQYGDYKESTNSMSGLVWDIKALDVITTKIRETVRDQLFRKTTFKLYHMTHVDNLDGIFERGLLCHNLSKNYVDISNKDVNSRRARYEKIFNMSLHDYTPLYFNPHNAMLFKTERESGSDIVILEISKSIIDKPFTLFSEGNAARDDANITCIKSKVASFDWNGINKRSWSNYDGIKDEYIKKTMMSETLILGGIEPSYITTIHTRGGSLNKNLQKRGVKVKGYSNLFFNPEDDYDPEDYI